ncbi:amidophosphoribosyltransferase [Alkalicoccus saliphilus]|uniref:Amidophosphoribosyltransferase n=2 Tax=Alkalicoccus saliphilus TaxID=200989 RepID=A0A2T4U7Q0_9BACI|nr:amidophosphoribosyltransferase [Alkalicoccus saliphilus]
MKTYLCLVCHEPLKQPPGWLNVFQSRPPLLCTGCRDLLEPAAGERCSICGHPDVIKRCSDCAVREKRNRFPPVVHRSLYTYNPFMKDLISQFKYRGDAELSLIFADDLFKLARREFPGFHTAVPIPLHPTRLWERGFNQASLLGQKFPAEELLIRDGLSTKQSKSSGKDRRDNAEGAFMLKHPADWSEKHILLIDDIYTTGSTIEAAALPFWEAGALRVSAVTAARALKKAPL